METKANNVISDNFCVHFNTEEHRIYSFSCFLNLKNIYRSIFRNIHFRKNDSEINISTLFANGNVYFHFLQKGNGYFHHRK